MGADFEGVRAGYRIYWPGSTFCELRVKGLAKTPRGTPNMLMGWSPSEGVSG